MTAMLPASDLAHRLWTDGAVYERDDREHLNNLGQHHPVAGISADHLRAALGERGDGTDTTPGSVHETAKCGHIGEVP